MKDKNHKVLRLDTETYIVDVFSVKGLLQQNVFSNILLFFGALAIVTSLLGVFFSESNIMVFSFSVTIIYIVAIIGIFQSTTEKKDNKEAIIENSPNKEYLLCLGTEVKEFKGDAVKSAKAKDNLIRPLLVNSETVKRHFLIMATIGAGKSVLMKGLIEQHIIAGGGLLCVDGKGTAEFAKEIYGLTASLGREDDFIHLNFLDMDNTHTINPLLSGSANSIYEILIALLIGEENEWKVKQKEFMKNVLKLMVWRRDNERDFLLNFSELLNLMDIVSLANVAIKYKDYAYESNAVKDFVKYVTSTLALSYESFLEGDKDDEKWVKSVIKATEGRGQGIYDVSVCTGAWRGVITNLSSDYGRVFNDPNPDISLWEATQRNKIIFVTLPTMDSDTTPKELGRLILGLIKGVAAQKAKDAREPKIPFICFFDELGSYVIEGFGRLESKSRSLGISVVPFFQSPAQIDVVAKNDYERKEIIDVTGVHILMKNTHPETTEFYVKMVEKEKILTKDFTERKEFAKGEGSSEVSYKAEERDAFKHNEVANMNNGEMMVFANGKLHRAIAQAETTLLKKGKKITYEGLTNIPIPLTQYRQKKVFLQEAYQIVQKIERLREKEFLHPVEEKEAS
ncbi:TraM recognition domain-containing protein [Helicobacter sp.]|uniref:type IV secretory system conjugative DNA transfer family protein n=2 Tax=Helicobacter sp. TaxID=218 RepID=UPI002582CB69|nr:TraM recognition domain-containing protein [Helicobacter sp.]MCI7047698.1 TraM recognition domain-containing protein [Helicobacter sp.]MDY5615709.1 TraM recognition domain-containing protein [Helicobacter sp.]